MFIKSYRNERIVSRMAISLAGGGGVVAGCFVRVFWGGGVVAGCSVRFLAGAAGRTPQELE